MDLKKNEAEEDARILEEVNASKDGKTARKEAAGQVLKGALYIIGAIVLVIGGCIFIVSGSIR